ncbi:MAG: glycosyltransferase family 39 protein [Bryobacteraceae bacterium]|nr:glycosyltransferase family 39 protein [Bryobacteraceae bacterium]MDW8378919.1 glycosyltransferase family 39 protein [Bryobacterales bacterium]
MIRWLQVILSFLIPFGLLSYAVWRVPVADGYVDPVGRIAAQDEALYSHISLRMAATGEWLAPKFLDRLALFKPPLLYWLSAACVRLFDANPFVLRLPSMLAGAATAALLLGILRSWAGIAALLLLLGDPLWHTLSRLALTDALLAAFTAGAVHAITRSSLLQFATCTAAALMTKGIAGLIPMIALTIWWLVSSPVHRWPLSRLILWLTAPLPPFLLWAASQLWLHPRWFWAEFVQVEILGYSFGTPPQTSEESKLGFYLGRLLRLDPLLLVVLGTCFLRARYLLGDPAHRAWLSLVLAVALALSGNQYRNIAYVLPAVPALAYFGGLLAAKHARPAAILLALVYAFRATQPDQPWGLRFQPVHNIKVRQSLETYAQLGRTHDLLIVDPEDEFVATTLGLRKVRYVYFGDLEPYRRYGLDFHALGIAVTLEEWRDRKARIPRYLKLLRQWGVDSAEPIASVIVLRDASELPVLIETTPEADFLLRRRWPSPHHEVRELPEGRVFLYAP